MRCTTWFTDWVNIDFVYTPQFDHDRFITGERMSFYNSLYGRTVGADWEVNFNVPSTWFEDDEYALRLYRMVGSAELAFYAYSGYWKSPGGQRFPPMQATFPKLSVYGASLRGNFLNGIGNVELAYYDSRQDRGGDNPFVNNSEFRLLLGYERELAKELTGGAVLSRTHDGLRRVPQFADPADHGRAGSGPAPVHGAADETVDAAGSDPVAVRVFQSERRRHVPASAGELQGERPLDGGGGGNVFFGEKPSTFFFGQFEDNTNVYGAVRYSF